MKEELRKRKNRFWAMLLAVVMIVGLMPGLGVSATDYRYTEEKPGPSIGDYITNGTDTVAYSSGMAVRYYDVGQDTSISGADTDNRKRIYFSSYNNINISYAGIFNSANSSLSGDNISNRWIVVANNDESVKLALQALPKYKITWNENGGTITSASAPATDFTRGDAAIVLPTSGSKAGLHFGGWKIESNTMTGTQIDSDNIDSLYNNNVCFNYNLNLNAVWKANVSYNLNGYNDNINRDVSVEEGNGLFAPADPSQEKATFKGWYKDENCTDGNDWKFSSPVADAAPIAAVDTVTQDMTLYAKWSYDVTFDAVNGYVLENESGTAIPVQKIDRKKLVTKPADPLSSNYTFEGWYKDAVCTNAWNFASDTVTLPTTLYAKWTKNKYNVTFDANGHGTAPNVLSNVEHGTTIAYPGVITGVDGYTFGGWYTDKECTNAWDFDNDTVTAATTLYAKWTVNQYTVTFSKNGQDTATATAPQAINYGSKVAKPADPTVTGYTFGGWYTDMACTNAWKFDSDNVTADVTLYAKWTPINYTITWKNDDGTVIKNETFSYGSVPSFSGADPVKETVDKIWSYNGWKINGTEYANGTGLPPVTGDMEFTAVFKENGVRQYIITFVDEDGTTVLKSATAYDYGTKASDVVLPTNPTKASDGTNNYTFLQWNAVKGNLAGGQIYDVIDDQIYKAAYLASTINTPTPDPGAGTTPPPAPTPDPGAGTTPPPAPTPDPGAGTTPTSTPTPSPSPSVTPTPSPEPTNNNDVEESFSSMFARIVKRTRKSITFKWKTQNGIDEYEIYGAKCKKNPDGTFSEYELLDTVKGDVSRYKANLKEKGYYKFYILAIKYVNNQRVPVKKSVDIHGTTKSDKYTCATDVAVQMIKIYDKKNRSVTVTANNKEKTTTEYKIINSENPIDVTGDTITLHVGQKIYLNGIESNPDEPEKKIQVHRGIRYESENSEKVSVSYKSGRVKANEITENPIKIYIFAQNGEYSVIKIKVIE